ncbi:unnamed protein product, partial [Brassica oleracea]
NLSEDSWKTLGRLLGKSSNAFYAIRLPAQNFFRSESNFGIFLGRLLEDSQKTLGKLLGKYSNVFYGRRLPAKSSGSLPKSYAQGGIIE